LAAALLRLAVNDDEGCAVQCQRVLDHIDRLGAEQRQRLRDQVDWVEAYERSEEEFTKRRGWMFTGPVNKPVDNRLLPKAKPASQALSRAAARL